MAWTTQVRRILATPASDALPANVRGEEQAAEVDAGSAPPDAGLLRGIFEPDHHTRCCPTTTCTCSTRCGRARELRGQIVEVRKETEDSATLVIKPGWGWSSSTGRVSTSASASRSRGVGTGGPTRSRRRRAEKRSASHHREGDARGFPVHAPRRRPPARARSCGSRAPKGDFVLPDPPPEKILFLTGGQRHHARHRDAADDGPPQLDARRPPRPLRADRRGRDVPRRARRPAEQHETLRSHVQFTDTDGMFDARPSTGRARTGASARHGPAGRRHARRDRARCGSTAASKTGCTSSVSRSPLERRRQ